MSRPRVLHLRASNFVGGPESQLLRSARLDRNGAWELLFGVFVGPSEGRAFRDAIEHLGLEVISLSAGSVASSVRELIQVLHEKQIGLICTHGYKADIIGLLAGHFAKVPVACFLRGWTRENRRVRLYEALDRFCLRFADRIICLSDSQANRISRERHLATKIHVVPNAIDIPQVDFSFRNAAREKLRRRFMLPEKCTLIATAGRLSPEKAIGDFLDAAAQVKQGRTDARFLIFGNGPLNRELRRKAIAAGLQNHVTFAEFQSDLRDLLPGLDLLVNPSHSEEVPNVVLEGMAAGIPVIATAVGGVEEIAGPQPSAVRLVPPARPRVLADTILELLTHPERAMELAKAGHHRVAKAYSVETQKEQFHALYEGLIPPCKVTIHALKPASTSPVASSKYEESGSNSELPFLSVVLPIRNEEAHVSAVLEQLQSQDYPHDRFEVLIAVGTSTDRTVEVVEKFRKRATIPVRRFDNPRKFSSAGRNIGARNSRGDYIIYVDGHCQIPSKTLLRDTVSLFEGTGADCLCRPQPLTMEGNSLFQNVVAHARATSLAHGRDSTIFATNYEGPVDPSSAGASYRRSVFDRIGYFDESFDACEDVEFNYRIFKAGFISYISPRLTIFYQPRTNVRLLWRQMTRYGRGRFRLIQKHQDAFALSQILPAVLVLWLVLGGAGALVSRPFSLAFGFSIAVYAAIVLYFSINLARHHSCSYIFIAPLIYFTVHLGLGAGFLGGALKLGIRNNRSQTNVYSATSRESTPL